MYGYLFSNLQTPYGYKRARWLDGDIERGFNLSASVLSPLTQEGSLLSNVSAFFGRIALGQNPERLSVLDRDSNAAGELKQFNYARLKWKRLVEMTSLSDGTQITLQSDLVPFTHERAINAALLIYSVSDSREDGPKLISGFPVSEAFMANALDPSKLGSDQNITTRYNIYVPGFNGTLKGKREVLTIHE
ncbi:MAG: hypothetical protein EOP09_03750 [Proteobacteria bacterium]|nr:MAG: hypothetical protein EOP09_03750 [Pseudomonadota bacterium]